MPRQLRICARPAEQTLPVPQTASHHQEEVEPSKRPPAACPESSAGASQRPSNLSPSSLSPSNHHQPLLAAGIRGARTIWAGVSDVRLVDVDEAEASAADRTAVRDPTLGATQVHTVSTVATGMRFCGMGWATACAKSPDKGRGRAAGIGCASSLFWAPRRGCTAKAAKKCQYRGRESECHSLEYTRANLNLLDGRRCHNWRILLLCVRLNRLGALVALASAASAATTWLIPLILLHGISIGSGGASNRILGGTRRTFISSTVDDVQGHATLSRTGCSDKLLSTSVRPGREVWKWDGMRLRAGGIADRQEWTLTPRRSTTLVRARRVDDSQVRPPLPPTYQGEHAQDSCGVLLFFRGGGSAFGRGDRSCAQSMVSSLFNADWPLAPMRFRIARALHRKFAQEQHQVQVRSDPIRSEREAAPHRTRQSTSTSDQALPHIGTEESSDSCS
ncbi:hypothetical protein BDK51DRAFT_48093 [Blyttiomyces helicus]|uniref:Uncharacterized protein n=1 Tax=Blyttiomyces helicus TaxID=388810 RepID=A0A4P9VUQ9_9FUNG|nr:hypothetical protein BDK51DRAFT_48093 [Blyttiomyces helicus]|eukprot:RKO83339.1 hypothetical protein BDK51DRAFT_48093 [Blyttiomyces helicus]